MQGVILDADSLGRDIDISPITSLLESWEVFGSTRPGETAERIANAHVILSNKVLLDKNVLSHASSLQFISIMATGTNNVDLAEAYEHKVTVSNARGYATPSVVQHTLSLILALARSLPQYLTDVRNGRWQASNVFCVLDHPIQEIGTKQLGIIGYGELGRGVAEAASALGMKIAISEHPGVAPRPGRQSFEDILADSDFVSLHCPLTPDTRHMINTETIALMKPGAYLINTARGGLIDSNALLTAIKENSIAGAAIDVLDTEPADKNEPLITDLKNLLVTPHNAWGALESRQRLIIQMKENIEGFLEGNPPRLVKPS